MNPSNHPEDKPKSWSRRKRARPSEILDAALKVFAEKGFAAARMEDIASRAGVTKGTIYLYFPSKEEVFKTLARETAGQALADAALHVHAFPGTPRDSIVMLLTAIADFLRKDDRAALPKIIISESGNFPELAKFWCNEVIDKAMAMLIDVFEQGVACGQFRPLPPEIVARLCVAPVIMNIIWRTTFVPHGIPPLDFEQLFATHLDILLHGLVLEGKSK